MRGSSCDAVVWDNATVTREVTFGRDGYLVIRTDSRLTMLTMGPSGVRRRFPEH